MNDEYKNKETDITDELIVYLTKKKVPFKRVNGSIINVNNQKMELITIRCISKNKQKAFKEIYKEYKSGKYFYLYFLKEVEAPFQKGLYYYLRCR